MGWDGEERRKEGWFVCLFLGVWVYERGEESQDREGKLVSVRGAVT